jgi:heme exporter protein C
MSASAQEVRTGAAAVERGVAWWKWLLAPWMLAVIVAAFVFVAPAQDFRDPGAARIIFFHVPVAILLFVWFFAAAWYGWQFLKRGDLRYDTRAAAAAEVGLLCTVLATVSGSIFAKVQWGLWWSWDPKQVAIVVVMFAYFAYFGLRSSIEDEDRRARLSSVYAILAGIAAPFILKGMQYLPIETLHPKDVIEQRRMSPDYQTVFYASVIGYLGITLWIYQLRLRLAWAESEGRER